MGNFWDLSSGLLSPKTGIYCYDSTISYKLNDVVLTFVSGEAKFYKSLSDNNSSSLSDTTKWLSIINFSNTDLSNLSSTGEAKIKSNIQLVNEVPAQPETGVLYVIPES